LSDILIDGRVKQLIGTGLGPAGSTAGGSREDIGSTGAGEEEVNAVENRPKDETEALPDKELPQWDVLMSEELEPPLKKIFGMSRRPMAGQR
jgi:hypothetical protein